MREEEIVLPPQSWFGRYKNWIILGIIVALVASGVYGGLQIMESFWAAGNTPGKESQISAQTPSPEASNSAAVAPAETPTPKKVSIAIYNGTSISGLARQVQDRLKNKFDDMNFVSVANTKGDFTKTTVINLNSKDAETKKIAAEINGVVANKMPATETTPDADILVIIGSDYKK